MDEQLSTGSVDRLYNFELMTDESRLAWERVPPLFDSNAELIRAVTGSENVSAHFQGSTLIGVGGTKDQESDVDVVFYTDVPSPEYDDQYLAVCAEVYPGFADSFHVSARDKEIMRETFQQERYRISTMAKKLHFDEMFHLKLDGVIVSIDSLLAHLQSVCSKIEENGGKMAASVTEDESQAMYLTANFLGSPSIFESTQGQDASFRNRLLGLFLGSSQGKELYTNAIQPIFHNFIVNYEHTHPSNHPDGLRRHRARVAHAFAQVFQRRQIPYDRQERAARFLRLQRGNVGLPDYDQLHLESTE